VSEETNKPNDGGPAFPVPVPFDPMHGVSADCGNYLIGSGLGGMSLRDWFAGQALVGIGSADVRSESRPDYSLWAHNAYRLADAMIKKRHNKTIDG
jgi:hypothetical protein